MKVEDNLHSCTSRVSLAKKARAKKKKKKEATCTSRAREIEKIKNKNEGSHNSLFLKCIYSIIISMYCKYKPIGHIWVFLSFVRFSYYMHIKPIDK